ncbi:MAG: flagellar basal body P-ring formation protein FlgA [Rhodospirillaceae bacterium]|nr:flagellar basal body P-ring formation protein FlgA [Rhodospirillaceae bacterium]
MRSIFLAAALIVLPALAPSVWSKAAAPQVGAVAGPAEEKISVRKSVQVNGHLVRLGDIFTISGEKADVEIAYAPEPGKRAVFDARWLYRVARAYKLDWRPLSSRIRTIVTRDSEIIGRAEIEEMLLAALAEKGADPNAEVDLSNRLLRLHVPSEAVDAIEIEEATYDERSRRFTAFITTPSGNGSSRRTRVRGRLFSTTEVPVLSRRILSGEIINREDLKWIKVRNARLQSNTIVNETDLVGHTPRRGLRAGYSIQMSAVQRPILVSKGSLVTMLLRTPQMLLTAQGKALQNGSEGDVIRISNSQSKTVIEAEVIGDGRVAVRPNTLLAMN